MRVSGCLCTQSLIDVGTPTHGYPEIDHGYPTNAGVQLPLHAFAGRRRNTTADPNPRVPRNWPQDASIQQGAGASWRENMAAPWNRLTKMAFDGGAQQQIWRFNDHYSIEVILKLFKLNHLLAIGQVLIFWSHNSFKLWMWIPADDDVFV